MHVLWTQLALILARTKINDYTYLFIFIYVCYCISFVSYHASIVLRGVSRVENLVGF